MIKKTLPILNLSCASCASNAQNILNQQKGVVSANVNFANGTATIEYDPTVVNLHQLKEALQSVGYDLIIEESDDTQDKLEELHHNYLKSLKRKTIGAIVFSIPLVIIAMTPSLMHMKYANYIMWLLATPVVFIFGWQFFKGAYQQIKHKKANMDTLVALSTGTAYLFSVFNTLFPGFWTNKGLEPHVYFEASAVIIAFILLGKLLEEKAKGNTSASIKKLMGLQPKTVTVFLPDGEQKEIPISSVHIGDVILVKPGDKIAVDGVVLQGSSFVDESMISGEPIPVEKKEGNYVYAGTINQKGSFKFEAKKVGADTLLSQIIKMVQEAQGSKAPVQKMVDKIASVFVPIVVLIAVASFISWMIWGGENAFSQALLSFVTVLVIACPCALGLATPTAIMVGIGKGAENGILIKDAESLELAQKVNAIVLDKTGTITEGKPIVTNIKWEKTDNSVLKNILYSIEKSSGHPLADAICEYLQADSVFLDGIVIHNLVGKGIEGIYDGEYYYIGNKSLKDEKSIKLKPYEEEWMDQKRSEANTVVIFGHKEEVICIIAISDRVKETSIEAVSQMKSNGIEVYMLTGDNVQTAKVVAMETGISHYKAGVLPQDKIDFIKDLQSAGKIVAMVGDGINDSGALAQADVSIAMGKGSDIAMDVAKMTIISNDLRKIMQAINLSKKTVKTIKQNLFWAFIYNIIGIPIAAGVLYPLNGFLLNPMVASAAMALSSVSVVANSLRLKYSKI